MNLILTRRRFLGLMAAGVAGATSLAQAATKSAPAGQRKPVVVLTAYPDEVVSRFEAAFEKAHPEYRLQMVWRMPHEALPYLRQPHQAGVDVYWSASPRTYATLAKEGALRKMDIDRSGLPDRIGKALLADPDGYYTVTEMAGYGFIVNTEALKTRQLPIPRDWTDLADPRYAGLLSLPSPAKVGFAPPIVEIVLQAYGWEKGWALWSEIAGNAFLLDRGATFVTDEVSSGRRPIGVSIDFFSASAIANGAPLQFVYPRHSGMNPAHVAITAEAPNPDGAKAFAQFVLSPEGQRILTHPDIRKLPVRPALYDMLPEGYFNPFQAAQDGVFDFDAEASLPRLGLTTALFEQMLAAPQAELASLWTRVRKAEAAGLNAAAARKALGTPLVTETDAAQASLRLPFLNRLEGSNTETITALESGWRIKADWQRAIARTQLENMHI